MKYRRSFVAILLFLLPACTPAPTPTSVGMLATAATSSTTILTITSVPTHTATSTPTLTSTQTRTPTFTPSPTTTPTNTATLKLTQTPAPTKTLEPSKTPTKVPSHVPATKSPTLDPVEQGKKLLQTEFKAINGKPGAITSNSDGTPSETIVFDRYISSDYRNTRDGHPIMIAIGGQNGFGDEEAKQINEWVNDSLARSPSLKKFIDTTRIRFLVEGGSSTSDNDAHPQFIGTDNEHGYWGIEFKADLWRHPENYKIDNATLSPRDLFTIEV